MSCFYRLLLRSVNSFCIQLCYFLSISLFGFVILKVLKPRTHDSFIPGNLDLFFTSVSAVTVSSLSTVEMEVFSNSQLIVLIILMFFGGKIFTSMVGLHFKKFQLQKLKYKISSVTNNDQPSTYQPELGMVESPVFENLESRNETSLDGSSVEFLKYKSIKFLCFVVLGYFLVVQILGIALFILFCSMEWNSAGLSGLNSYQKIIGVLFQTTNTRYAGESIVDLSTISSALLVLFVVMMYLPPYTCFLPITDGEEICEEKRNKKGKLLENILFSPLSYLAIFTILICITERQKLKKDPLNFNVWNILVEVVSAYGSVGFTTGYSCDRQIQPNNNCENKFYGFSGKWSDEGKIILIVVMFFGRLKFNMEGGKAWKLL
ncbi:unnamed protein product [Dovyalis caffra]|uniref:Sodium transporter HKT1 n=1 Tax=Dovyalis caffra TaxID=77055 RepID=A0AAV1S449_9ROSI|nr:unnamed protein product [Dovyalis caffra]